MPEPQPAPPEVDPRKESQIEHNGTIVGAASGIQAAMRGHASRDSHPPLSEPPPRDTSISLASSLRGLSHPDLDLTPHLSNLPTLTQSGCLLLVEIL